MKTTWRKVIDFFNAQPTNKIVSRAEYIEVMKAKGIAAAKRYDTCQCDWYRRKLELAGFLFHQRGYYIRKVEIPENLSIGCCLKIIKGEKC
jgi:hypothetical protein